MTGRNNLNEMADEILKTAFQFSNNRLKTPSQTNPTPTATAHPDDVNPSGTNASRTGLHERR